MSTVRIALVRSIVIARQRLSNDVLLDWGSAVGGRDCRAIGATGNLVFRSRKAPATLERELEAACARHFGGTTEIVVKTGEQWRALIAANPFIDEAAAVPAHLLVWAMRTPLPDAGLVQLERRARGDERIARVASGDLFMWFGAGEIAQSKLPAGFGLSQLGAVGTNRNWNTARRISDAVEALAG